MKVDLEFEWGCVVEIKGHLLRVLNKASLIKCSSFLSHALKNDLSFNLALIHNFTIN